MCSIDKRPATAPAITKIKTVLYIITKKANEVNAEEGFYSFKILLCGISLLAFLLGIDYYGSK